MHGSGAASVTITLVVAAVLVAGVLYATNAAHAVYPWVNHDVVYHSYLGFEMLQGSRLYVDLKEDNPPGSPLLLAALVAAGDLLGLPDFLAQHAFILILGLAGLAVLRVALPRAEDRWRLMLVTMAYLFVIIRGGFSNNLFPTVPEIPYDFGQREQMFSLVFVPYLAFRLSRRRVPWPLLPYWFLVGFIALFKPFWAPMIVVVELASLVRGLREGWPARAALGAGMLGPFFFLFLHSRESFVAFFVENVPMYLRGAYTHYDTSWSVFAVSPLHLQMAAAGLLALAGAVTVWRLGWMNRPDVALLLAVDGIAYFSVVHQHKFWSYHTMVYFALVLFSIALFLGTIAGRLATRAWRNAVVLGVAAATLAGTVQTLNGTVKMLRDYPPLGCYLVPLIEPYPRVMFLSMSVTTTYAPMLLRRRVVGPWTVLVDLPELLAIPDEARRRAALAGYAERIGRSIDELQPDLLVFSPEGLALPRNRRLPGIFTELGVVPRRDYVRVPVSELLSIDRHLRDWVVYRRLEPSS